MVPDCFTLTACTMAAAPRGMTTAPPIITGSSTTALNVIPAWDASASIDWASRTFTVVPTGTVTVLTASFGASTGAWRGAGGGGGGGGLRTVNSTATASSRGTSET